MDAYRFPEQYTLADAIVTTAEVQLTSMNLYHNVIFFDGNIQKEGQQVLLLATDSQLSTVAEAFECEMTYSAALCGRTAV